MVDICAGLQANNNSGWMVQGMTSVAMTTVAYEVKKGDTVLVHAAAGE